MNTNEFETRKPVVSKNRPSEFVIIIVFFVEHFLEQI